MGSYTMDSHNVQRYITPEGTVQNEGDIGVSTRGPYAIARGTILPKKAECGNLVVPVCVSSSHIAFGSIRMEPVFMILGHSAATVGAMAIDADCAVQDVPYEKLRQRLLADGQILESHFGPTGATGKRVDAKKLAGIVVDETEAKFEGHWTHGFSVGPWVGRSYMHDGNMDQGTKSATFETAIPDAGMYEIRISYTPHANRATAVPVLIETTSGTKTVHVNQQNKPPIDNLFLSLGQYSLGHRGRVTVCNKDTRGYVIVDAVQWLRKGR